MGTAYCVVRHSELHAPRDIGHQGLKTLGFVQDCSNITRHEYSNINAPRVSQYRLDLRSVNLVAQASLSTELPEGAQPSPAC
jgi:hypothetical protein